MSGVKPIPVILTVQALNGLLLPLLTFYLIWMASDASIVPRQHQHGRAYNLVLLLILFATLVIGLHNIDRSVGSAFGLEIRGHLWWVVTGAALLTGYASLKVFGSRSPGAPH
jgi:Mn2+/Fe2+ NRAMP family transporter